MGFLLITVGRVEQGSDVVTFKEPNRHLAAAESRLKDVRRAWPVGVEEAWAGWCGASMRSSLMGSPMLASAGWEESISGCRAVLKAKRPAAFVVPGHYGLDMRCPPRVPV